MFDSNGGGYWIGNNYNTGAFSEAVGVLNSVAAADKFVELNKESGFKFKASNSNAIYGRSSTVQPSTLAVILLIKY